MAEGAFETMVLRNDFYRDGFRKLVLVLFGLVIANVASFSAVYWIISHPPQTKYFATSPDGRIVPVNPLSQKVYSNAEIQSWATSVILKSFAFDFVNYRQQLQDVAGSYTGLGWRSFQKALTDSRELDTVISQRAVMSALPSGAPTILTQQVNNGRYSWMIKLPIVLRIQGPIQITQPMNVMVQIDRVSLVNNPKGIGVSRFVAQT